MKEEEKMTHRKHTPKPVNSYVCASCGAEIVDAPSYKQECSEGCFEAMELGQLIDFDMVKRG